MDFTLITPCGECCEGCKKKDDGQCHGCLKIDGHCEEWAGSGVCPTYAAARNTVSPFAGCARNSPATTCR